MKRIDSYSIPILWDFKTREISSCQECSNWRSRYEEYNNGNPSSICTHHSFDDLEDYPSTYNIECPLPLVESIKPENTDTKTERVDSEDI